MTKVLSLFAAATLVLGACSTSNQVAQQKNYNDDVYYSQAKATEQEDIVRTPTKQSPSYNREDLYDDDPYNYNYNYNNRYNQYYLSPRYSYITPYNRYTPWYDYSYGSYYNNWYSPGISFYIGSNPWLYNNIYTYNYGYPYSYNNSYGGIYSYNTYYPGYGYGAYNGGVNDPNYRARPGLRGSENLSGSIPGLSTIRTDAQGRVMTSPSRGEIYERNNTGSSARPAASTTSTSRPARTSAAQQPQRTQAQPQPAERVYTPPPASSTSTTNSGGGGGGGGAASDDRARPARAGN